MKRLTLICVVFINSFLQAQSWVEDFNSTAGHSIPAGWTQYNGDHLGVWPFDSYSSHLTISDGWITEPFNTLHGKCAISNCSSNGAPTGSHVNDWLITPSFTVPVNSIFTWEAIAPDHWNPNSY